MYGIFDAKGDRASQDWPLLSPAFESELFARERLSAHLRSYGCEDYCAWTVLPIEPAVLPADSAARKEIPVCTGCLDYAPDAICVLVDLLYSGEAIDGADSNDVLTLLPCRGGPNVTAQLAQVCLDLLEDELRGAPAQCRSNQLAVRWPRALAEIAKISKAGNDKHNPGEPLHHARGKSMDHPDCMARHTFEMGGYDGPFRHTGCLAWRAIILLQEECEAEGAPLARAAWLPDGRKGSDRFAPGVDVDFEKESAAE
jgi:hypothetical protein